VHLAVVEAEAVDAEVEDAVLEVADADVLLDEMEVAEAELVAESELDAPVAAVDVVDDETETLAVVDEPSCEACEERAT
jgi:hypothetical protein